jgi:iron complex outermembrane receptor protein
MTIVNRCNSALFLLMSLLVAGPAAAQGSEDGESSTNIIEEVIVTAQKRDQNLQTVPIAITAVGAETIDELGIVDLSGISTIATSVRLEPTGFMSIRGVGDFARNIGSGARATVYIDGVLVGRSYAFNQNLVDVEMVEVLRGPQGTLFGKNSVSGAVNITTGIPHDALEGQVSAEYGNFDHVMVEGQINIPLSESIFFGIEASYLGEDGYIDNVYLDRELNGRDRRSIRGKLRFLAGDNTDIILGADYLEQSVPSTIALALPQPGGGLGGYDQAPGRYEASHDINENSDVEYKGASLTVNHDFKSDYALTSITAYRENSFSQLQEEDYSSVDFAHSFLNETSDQFSQELRINSSATGNFDYVIGIYYLDQNLGTARGAGSDEPFLFGAPFLVFTPGELDDTSTSAYIHTNYRFSDQWELTAGLRYTHQKKSIDYSIHDSTGFLFMNLDHFKDSRTDDEWSPLVSLNYQVDENTMTYALYSSGFKSGGWNADFITTIDQIAYDPEYATNYEIGLKTTMLDNKLRLNVAGFLTKFDDYQVNQFVPVGGDSTGSQGSIFTITNAGKVTSKGIEIEATAAPTEGLVLTANYSYIDAVYDEYEDGGGPGIDYDGNDLGADPTHNIFGAVDYVMSAGSASLLKFHLDYVYGSSRYTEAANTEFLRLDSISQTNARLTYVHEKSGWEFQLWALNLFDNELDVRRNFTFLGIHIGYQDSNTQRRYGIKARYTF